MFQQVASEEYFRQPKIAYRFISDRLICVLDKENNLLLNSANMFIPKNYPIETTVSFFNSDIYTYIYKKMFHSKKVLKSHLKAMPLPVLSIQIHKKICKLYNMMETDSDAVLFQEKIDGILCEIFKLEQEQYNYIKGVA